VLFDEPMSRHTSLKVGGPADIYAVPEDVEDLKYLLAWLESRQTAWMTVGRGYNLLVRDKGVRGAVISLEYFNHISDMGGGLVRAEAGADNLSVVRFAQTLGLGGIGFMSGIPGTVGGAIRMNAGAYGSGILEKTDALTMLRNGVLDRLPLEQLDYGYRRLALQPGDIVLAADFRLEQRSAEETEQEIRKDLELRRSKHNVGLPSAGSFFKNPAGQAAWRLIDMAGLRGVRVGGAQVSEVHSNFLVNCGGATAADFLALSALVKQRVNECSGVQLEEEVQIVGEE